jgi:hypothetical protein
MEISLVVFLVPIILILFALYKLWKLIQQILKKSKSQSWQMSSAEVVSKRVTRRISTRSGVSYYPELAYRYNVMGQSFEKTIRLPKNFTEQKADEKLDKIGNTIEVRFDPNQPKDHISEFDIVNYWDILLIVIFFVLAGFIIVPYLL